MILLLVELLVVSFLIVAGIVIDGTILATSKTQRLHVAEYVAIEAIQTYNETPGTYDVKLEAARVRAQSLANVNVYLAKPFTANPSATESIGTNSSTTVVGSRNGRIIPGIWHHVPPADCSAAPTPCPCDALGDWAGPCFQELDLDADPTLQPNAFRTELSLPVSSPFKTILARVIGIDTLEVTAEAIATTVPRNGVFLVDLSRSSHFETHLPYEGAGADARRATESSFYVSDRSCPVDFSNPCLVQNTCALAGGPYPSTPLPPLAPIYTGLYDYIWENQGNGAPRSLTHFPSITPWQRPGTAPNTVKKHYRSDYGCYDVSFTDGTAPAQSANYLVDRYVGPMGTLPYDGPEPLTSMLFGVHEALELVSNQKVPGDGLGLIGFDQSAKIQERRFPVSAPSAGAYQDMLDITDITAPTGSANQTKRIRDHLFFVRPDAKANYPEALQEALTTLRAAPNAALKRNFVVILGDGLSSCDASRVCGGAESDFNYAYSQIGSLVEQEFIPNEYQLHMLLIGDYVNPHTILTRSATNPSQCMDDREARSSETPLMLTDSESDADNRKSWGNALTLRTNSYFYGPNQLYRLVRDTDGIWAPVRKPCTSGGVPGDVRAALNAACAAATSGVKTDAGGNPTDSPLPVSVSPSTDADGRLSCDPQGRAKREQISEFMRAIVGTSPYVLVTPSR